MSTPRAVPEPQRVEGYLPKGARDGSPSIVLGPLPGEDVDTIDASDARHWISIYTELLAFKDDMLAKTERRIGKLSTESRSAVNATDLRLWIWEQAQVTERLAFWHSRHFELAGLEMNAEHHTIRHKAKTVFLTKREYQLLAFLLEHPHRSFTAEQLIALAWRKEELSPEEIRTYIGRVRQRIKELALDFRVINRPRHGYSIESEPLTIGPNQDRAGQPTVTRASRTPVARRALSTGKAAAGATTVPSRLPLGVAGS